MAQHLMHFPTTAISSINLGQAVTATAASLAAAPLGCTDRSGPSRQPCPVGKRAEVVRRAVEVLETAGYLNGRSEEMVANTGSARRASRADRGRGQQPAGYGEAPELVEREPLTLRPSVSR